VGVAVTHSTILSLSDAGHPPAAIASAIPTSLSTVYATLRAARPLRKRAPRERTSEKRRRVLAARDAGYRARDVAMLVGCSEAYVYRILAEQVVPPSPTVPPPPY
jgi:hypothetical protein